MPAFLCSFLVGLLAWTLAEYALHRWMGHARRRPLRVTAHHHAHHQAEGWFAPAGPKALLVLRVLAGVGGLGAAAGLAVGRPAATGLGLATGFGLGFGVYEWVHWRFHSVGPHNRLGARLRLHHFAHHNGVPNDNFGVTSRFWDWALGTRVDVERVQLRASRAPRWLIDPATGGVRPAFATHYALVGWPRPSVELSEPNAPEPR